MNNDNISLNEHYIKKIILQFAAVLLFLILAGFFMRSEVNDLLNATLEKMMARQTSNMSIVAEERFSKELAELRLAAKYLEVHPNSETEKNFLLLLKMNNHQIKVGMLKFNGSVIHGENLSTKDFFRLREAYRGNNVVDYCVGKGLLFAVPVMRSGNVTAVIYRLYDERLLTDLFGLSEYNSDVRLLIQERNGQIIVPYKNYGEEDEKFFDDDTVQLGFKKIREKLETHKSAAVYSESERGKYFLFATDLPQTNCTMIGYVAWSAVAGDIFRIYTLLLIAGTLMLIVLALVSAYLFVVRTKAEESDALREAKRLADEANNAKSLFLANMSHEIRTPINAIIGMNEMILRESQDPDIVRYAQNSFAASDSLLSLINDILDFSKIESGKFELVNEKYRVDKLVQNLVTMMRQRAEKKGLSFKVNVNPEIENSLSGDSVRIRQIVLNMLTNAVKYTRVGGVEFSVDGQKISPHEIELQFTVKDTGIGIREENLPKLFEDFERFDAKKNKNIEGTGLGLAITKKLVEMMNGKIEVHSVYGEGSTFTVSIPQEIVGDELIGTFNDETSGAPKKYHPSFIAPDAEILVVDDNEMNLMVAVGLLKPTKVKVDTAISGMVCLKKLAEKHYDLIFLDQMMPSLDGIQTLKLAKTMAENLSKDAPIIALTANAISGTREMLIGEGFTDYLSKPIDVKLMERMLRHYLPPEKLRLLPTDEPSTTSTDEPSKVSTDETQTTSTDETQTTSTDEPSTTSIDETQTTSIDETSTTSIDETSQEENSPLTSAIINVEMGLEYSAGMSDMYKEVLLTFAKLKPDKQAKIQEAFDSEDWKNYTVYVHSLKSTALSIGGEKTSSLAKDLEKAGKILTAATSSELEKHESEEFIKNNHASAMELYDELAQEAERLAATL